MYSNNYGSRSHIESTYTKGSSLSNSAANLFGYNNKHYQLSQPNQYRNHRYQHNIEDSSIKKPFQDSYEQFTLAKSMIQNRLEHLHMERDMIERRNAFKVETYIPYGYDTPPSKITSQRKTVINPQPFRDPIYYPYEMPINAEPIHPTRVDLGGIASNNTGGGFSIQDVLLILKLAGKSTDFANKDEDEEKTDSQKDAETGDKAEEGKDAKKPMRDLWKVVRDFTHVYVLMSTARKYAKYSKTRNSLIRTRILNLQNDLSTLSSWIKTIITPFLDEFRIFKDSNVIFKNADPKPKIETEARRIIKIIKLFMENLMSNTSKLINIPETVKIILYKYVSDKNYYPKKYLSTFQLNRLNFDFYGTTLDLKDSQIAMIIAFLLIIGIVIQHILLHTKDILPEYKGYPNINISSKYIGSIIHYLTRDTFKNDPPLMKDPIALINYYNNYYSFPKDQLKKHNEAINDQTAFNDTDEYAKFLIPEAQISNFWHFNPAFVEDYHNSIYRWACNLGKAIREKYSRTDPNLRPKKRREKPPNKKAKPMDND